MLKPEQRVRMMNGAEARKGSVGILAGMFLIPSVCLAEEGFHSSKEGLPPGVQAAWDSTFLVEAVAGKGAVGTAFVVRIELEGDKKLVLYLLTADHVVQGNCG